MTPSNPKADWPTVRRYPRTAGDAWRDAEYACAIERSKERHHRWWDLVEAILAVVVLFAIVVGVLP